MEGHSVSYAQQPVDERNSDFKTVTKKVLYAKLKRCSYGMISQIKPASVLPSAVSGSAQVSCRIENKARTMCSVEHGGPPPPQKS
jgi:hypothetical protein